MLLPPGVNPIAVDKKVIIPSCLFCAKSLEARNKKTLFISLYNHQNVLGKRYRLVFIYTVV
jgi:hypothetical protein